MSGRRSPLGELLAGVVRRRRALTERARAGDPALLLGDDGRSLHGRCSRCERTVDNHDEQHRVTALTAGGRGVECVLRGDIRPDEAGPLGPREA